MKLITYFTALMLLASTDAAADIHVSDEVLNV